MEGDEVSDRVFQCLGEFRAWVITAQTPSVGLGSAGLILDRFYGFINSTSDPKCVFLMSTGLAVC